MCRSKRHQERDLDGKRARLGLTEDVKLLPEADEDVMETLGIEFGDPNIYAKKLRKKRTAIAAESIFSSTGGSGSAYAAPLHRRPSSASKLPKASKASRKNQLRTF